ncbi:MAG: hypothetical protein AAF649_00900 [Verrucomicrobiota bacterium]
MTFSSYMEINILIDMFLILILTAVVLPRAPKLYVAMLLLNLAQYAVIIPHISGDDAPIRFGWSDGQNDSPTGRHSLPASNPLELMGRAQTAFSTVSGAMSGGGGIKTRDENAGKSVLRKLETAPVPARGEPASGRSHRVTLAWQEVMQAAIHDPHAMWLGMRVFWLAAAFMLFIQRPLFGMAAACSNLIPVPFLVTAGPYLYHQFNRQEAVQRANAAVEDSETLKEYLIEFATSNGLAVLLLAIMILGGIALLQRRHRLRALKQLKQLERFLDSSRYRAELNGTEYDFCMDHNILMINGLRFNVDAMRPDLEISNKWFIKPHNVLVFIPREDPTAVDGRLNKPRYSYQRKN